MTLIQTLPLFTRQHKQDAVAREISFRERVYERRVSEGKMTQKKADFELGVMRAIGTDYTEPALTDRQIELIRKALVALLESTDEVAKAELHGINDALREMQR